VEGKPVPKARPRVVRKGGRTWSFTPKKTKDWEKKIAEEARNHFEEPFCIPVRLSLTFYLKTPKSREGQIYVQTIPDLDNLEKSVLDALNGIAYDDDKRVVSKTSEKIYGNNPRVEIKICPLE